MNRIENSAIFFITCEIENDLRLGYAFLQDVKVDLQKDQMAKMEELIAWLLCVHSLGDATHKKSRRSRSDLFRYSSTHYKEFSGLFNMQT